MIKYIGSKRKLIPQIIEAIDGLDDVKKVVDLFSGTSRVGYALKEKGYCVTSNDLNYYALVIATAFVQADDDLRDEAQDIIEDLNKIKGEAGYFTQTFCIDSLFFQPKNGEKVDAIREWIAAADLDWELECILLTSLMLAADRVDSTTGVQMAYLKNWAPRAYNDLELRLPALLPRPNNGKCHAVQGDAAEMASNLKADVFYLDPPYNQHKYLGNYHIWESLCLWDKPEVYGVACKREDCKTRTSEFNSKVRAFTALQDTINNIDSRYIIVSFNDEGYISKGEMEDFLSSKGNLIVNEIDYKRYVGAQIGIHNPQGEKVGEVKKLRNLEYLYILDKEK
jgi:adenine-specific DNA-methyltransferase